MDLPIVTASEPANPSDLAEDNGSALPPPSKRRFSFHEDGGGVPAGGNCAPSKIMRFLRALPAGALLWQDGRIM